MGGTCTYECVGNVPIQQKALGRVLVDPSALPPPPLLEGLMGQVYANIAHQVCVCKRSFDMAFLRALLDPTRLGLLGGIVGALDDDAPPRAAAWCSNTRRLCPPQY